LMADPTGGMAAMASLQQMMMGQQQLIMQLLTLLMQLMAGSGGLANLAPGGPGFNAGGGPGFNAGPGPGGTPGVAGAAGGGGGGGAFNTPGGVAADPSQFQGGTEMSRRLAAAALRESTDGDSNGGWCARDVGEALRAVGLGVARGDAWTKAAVLAGDPRFRELKVAPNEIDKLPPGAIIVWDKGPGLPYGHISIALGDGREASDLLKKQMHLKTSYRVFLPI
ncbi:CHAP domain-containing protein, partial [bacterium CPR1]|nr:CHAP domain-containing protein [bacterium CPR1]